MTRTAGVVLVAAGAAALACAGGFDDAGAHSHLQQHRAPLEALCRDVPALLGEQRRMHVDHGPGPASLQERLRAVGVSEATHGSAAWASDGVAFTVSTTGLGVSGTGVVLFCGRTAPYPLVPNTKEAARGAPHGSVCSALEPGWFVCRDWT